MVNLGMVGLDDILLRPMLCSEGGTCDVPSNCTGITRTAEGPPRDLRSGVGSIADHHHQNATIKNERASSLASCLSHTRKKAKNFESGAW
jgi:hypothetical protein